MGVNYHSNDKSSIMIQPFPEVDDQKIDEKSEQTLKWIQAFIMGVRTVRGEMNLSPNKMLSAFYKTTSNKVDEAFSANLQSLKALAKLGEVRKLEANEPPPVSTHIIAGDFEIFIPLEGTIDNIDAEIQRLNKELQKHNSDFEFAQKKLSNENFVAKASPDAVEKEKQRKETASQAISKITETMNKMKALQK